MEVKMETDEVLQRIGSCGVTAVIRLQDREILQDVCRVLIDGGVKVLEITMTVPGAISAIKELTAIFNGQALIGAGTVMNVEDAVCVIEAGAQFVVSPIYKNEIIDTCNRMNTLVMPGCFTPTEIYSAWERGAEVIKIFPATKLGPQFIKDIHGPMKDVLLVPTGGVSLNNAAEFIRAGAYALGVGTDLLNKRMIRDHDWNGLAKRAELFIQAVKSGRCEPLGETV